jgi:hypothetical protein
MDGGWVSAVNARMHTRVLFAVRDARLFCSLRLLLLLLLGRAKFGVGRG